ncbi:major facilitator superfamily domain-containing protein [Stachybotrys elegans]|uniref:Major facilitator superfamily domain-containing protein n=1 Tax=Stachybotrys elegans TaxID=80388 RepID=A0A8K0SXR2_9HYPO|nr:major facilitator superfamily domain-containing protein [Stachybotrys elegans]
MTSSKSQEILDIESKADVYTTQGKSDVSTQDVSPAPEGGLEAWLVVLGAFFILFCGLGYSNSWGVFQEYYMTHQLSEHSANDIAWIGSLAAFLQFAAGALAGPMFDRYGQKVLIPASLGYVFALMITSLCTQYWQFMLAQGVLTGMCSAFLQLPVLAAVSQWFDKKRAMAFGIVISGSSIGGLIYPIALSRMLNVLHLSYAWSVRIMAFISLPPMIFACIVVKPRLPPQATSFFYPEAFKDTKYILVIAASFLTFFSVFMPLFFLPTYAVSRGTDPALASYLLSILNAASFFGRVIPGILADKYGRLNIFATMALASSIMIFCMNQVQSDAGFVVFTVIFGLTSGGCVSGCAACFSICITDPKRTGSYLGMGLGIASLAVLTGPPVVGALLDRYGGFSQICILSGTFCFASGLVAFGTKSLAGKGLFGKS